MAYEKTTVDAMKSWGEINSILYAHGCEGTSYSEIPERGFQIEFVRRVEGRPVLVRIPVAYDLEPRQRNGKPVPPTAAQREQERRTKWRSLYYWIKAQFDAMDKGIVSYEQAFLADIVVGLPDGRRSRVIDAIRPELDGRAFDVGKLLPEARYEVRHA